MTTNRAAMEAARDALLTERRHRDAGAVYVDLGGLTTPEIDAILSLLNAALSAPETGAGGGLLDAAENVLIAYGMGWDLPGVMQRLEDERAAIRGEKPKDILSAAPTPPAKGGEDG